MQDRIYTRPFISFLPFLLLYIVIVLVSNSDVPFGDEPRYFMFAENLLDGFYSPPPPDINLWNGPGFPLYLAPFVALHAPLLLIKLFNALLHYFSLVFFYKTLCRFLPARTSFFTSVVFGLYYMPFKGFPHVLSETFTIFLIAAITLKSVLYFSDDGGRRSALSPLLLAFLLGLLALTKVIFGPVFLATAILFLILFLATRNKFYRRASGLLVGALVFCTPYLSYTYSLTEKLFYWSNAGGMSLYWMSNPNPGEWGEWQNDSLTSAKEVPDAIEKYRENHEKIYADIYRYHGVKRDEKFREYAVANIKSHPGKFFLNWLANWSRMFFNYPSGYFPVRWSTVGNAIANLPVLVFMFISFFLTWKNRHQVPQPLKFLLILSAVYLLASSFLSAYDRMFYILCPVFGLWIAYSIVRLRNREKEVQETIS